VGGYRYRRRGKPESGRSCPLFVSPSVYPLDKTTSDGGDLVDAVIWAEGLTKWFGSVTALDGINLEVRGGCVLALLGPNGAGKTTTVRILSTVLRPDSGRATVLGFDVAAEAAAVRAVIGLAGQYAAVDENLTGRENLRLAGQLSHQPPSVIPARASDLLERFALTGAANRPVRGYSGGMRRRLDLAAALVHRPPVLYLDEPTTGLDPAAAPVREYAADQPVSATANAVRSLLIGGPTTTHVLVAIAWSIGLVAVFAPLAVRRYRRTG
jgi:ABC-type Na+ transport system ATPase subunit NatA